MPLSLCTIDLNYSVKSPSPTLRRMRYLNEIERENESYMTKHGKYICNQYSIANILCFSVSCWLHRHLQYFSCHFCALQYPKIRDKMNRQPRRTDLVRY